MSLIGSTRPTFSDNLGAGLGTGTVTGGNLFLNFGTGFMSTSANMRFSSGSNFTLSGSGAIIGSGLYATGSFFAAGPAPVCYPSSCPSVMLGFVAGPGGTYAGYVYMVPAVSGTSAFTINGALAFH